jgi:hypothetical protein
MISKAVALKFDPIFKSLCSKKAKRCHRKEQVEKETAQKQSRYPNVRLCRNSIKTRFNFCRKLNGKEK